MLRNVIVTGMLTVGLLTTGLRRVGAQLEFGTPQKMGPNINDEGEWDAGPSLSHDGLEIFFTGGPGRHIFSAVRESTDGDFGPRQTIQSKSGHPSVAADGLSLYYQSGDPDNLWVMTKDTIEDEWGHAESLGSTVNSPQNDRTPTISADGRELYFVSDRPRGDGNYSIWVTNRPSPDSPWEDPVKLGPHINVGTVYDGCPETSADGLKLFFCAWQRSGGFGAQDIWMATRETRDGPWGEPENLGSEINTADSEIDAYLSADESELYFARGELAVDTYDLWRVPVVTPPPEHALQPGDADQDCSFDQLDLVRVLQAGKYLSGDPATWGEGDWNGAPGGRPGHPPAGDGDFGQLDVIAALSAGMYLQGAYCDPGEFTAPSPVPEPSTVILLALGIAGVALLKRRSQGYFDSARARATVFESRPRAVCTGSGRGSPSVLALEERE